MEIATSTEAFRGIHFIVGVTGVLRASGRMLCRSSRPVATLPPGTPLVVTVSQAVLSPSTFSCCPLWLLHHMNKIGISREVQPWSGVTTALLAGLCHQERDILWVPDTVLPGTAAAMALQSWPHTEQEVWVVAADVPARETALRVAEALAGLGRLAMLPAEPVPDPLVLPEHCGSHPDVDVPRWCIYASAADVDLPDPAAWFEFMAAVLPSEATPGPVLVLLRGLRVPLHLVVVTAAAYAPAWRFHVWVDEDALLAVPMISPAGEPLPGDLTETESASIAAHPASLRVCPSGTECAACRVADRVLADSVQHPRGTIGAAHVEDIARRVAAEGWYFHQGPAITPLQDESIRTEPEARPEAEAAEISPQEMILALLAGLAHAPPPPLSRSPWSMPGFRVDTRGRVCLPWASASRPRAQWRRSGLTPGSARTAILHEIVVGVAAGELVPVPRSFVRATWLMFAINQGGKTRVCVDLSPLKAFTVDFSVDYASPWDLFTADSGCGAKLDIKSAFKSIPISRDDWPYLCVQVDDRFYAMAVLWFGLQQGPALYTARMRQILAPVRSAITLGLPLALVDYMDDVGVAGPDTEVTQLALLGLMWWLLETGQWIAVNKCHFVPATGLRFLGVLADFPERNLRVLQSATMKIADDIRLIYSNANPGERLSGAELRVLTRILGRLSFIQQVLHLLRPFRVALNKLLGMTCPVWDARAIWELSNIAFFMLHAHEWSMDRVLRPPFLVVVTDACEGASGAALWRIVPAEGPPGPVALTFIDLTQPGVPAAVRAASAAFELWVLGSVVEYVNSLRLPWASLLAYGDALSAMTVLSRQAVWPRSREFPFHDVIAGWDLSAAGAPRLAARSTSVAEAALHFLQQMQHPGRTAVRPWLAVWHRRSAPLARVVDALSDALTGAVPWPAYHYLRALFRNLAGRLAPEVDLNAEGTTDSLGSRGWCLTGSGVSSRRSQLSSIFTWLTTLPRRDVWPVHPTHSSVWASFRTFAARASGPLLVWLPAIAAELLAHPDALLWLLVPLRGSMPRRILSAIRRPGVPLRLSVVCTIRETDWCVPLPPAKSARDAHECALWISLWGRRRHIPAVQSWVAPGDQRRDVHVLGASDDLAPVLGHWPQVPRPFPVAWELDPLLSFQGTWPFPAEGAIDAAPRPCTAPEPLPAGPPTTGLPPQEDRVPTRAEVQTRLRRTLPNIDEPGPRRPREVACPVVDDDDSPAPLAEAHDVRAWPVFTCRQCLVSIPSADPCRFCDVDGCTWAVCRACAPAAKDDRVLLCAVHQLAGSDSCSDDAGLHESVRTCPVGSIGRCLARIALLAGGASPVELAMWPAVPPAEASELSG